MINKNVSDWLLDLPSSRPRSSLLTSRFSSPSIVSALPLWLSSLNGRFLWLPYDLILAVSSSCRDIPRWFSSCSILLSWWFMEFPIICVFICSLSNMRQLQSTNVRTRSDVHADTHTHTHQSWQSHLPWHCSISFCPFCLLDRRVWWTPCRRRWPPPVDFDLWCLSSAVHPPECHRVLTRAHYHRVLQTYNDIPPCLTVPFIHTRARTRIFYFAIQISMTTCVYGVEVWSWTVWYFDCACRVY